MGSTELQSDTKFAALLEADASRAGVPWPAVRLYRALNVLGCDPNNDTYKRVTEELQFLKRLHELEDQQLKELRRLKTAGTPVALGSFTKELVDLGFVTCLVWQRDTASKWVEACALTSEGFKALSVLEA